LRTDSVDDFCEVYEFNDKEANWWNRLL
jgi:hypothetical protein